MNRSNRDSSRASSRSRRLALVESVETRRLLASVSGVVFSDNNGDGVQQANDPGLNFEVVYADRNNNNTYDGNDVATRTNVNGQYVLDNLPADGAKLTVRVRGETGSRVISPAGNGYAITFASAMSAEKNRNFAVKPTMPTGTVTVSGRAYLDNDFSNTFTIGDAASTNTVFADLNGNLILEPGEPSATPNASTGEYTLVGVPANKDLFVVTTVASSTFGVGRTTPAAGGALTHVDLTSRPSSRAATIVPFNDTNGDGAHQSSEQPQKLLDLWTDLNGNGIHDAGEQTASFDSYNQRYVVNVLQVPGSTSFSTTLAYRLIGDTDNKADGSQVVTITPAMPFNPPPTFYLPVKPSTTQSATISGRLTNDANGNGVHDAGEEGLNFEVVYLDRNNNGQQDASDLATRTDASGNYTFAAQLLDGSTVVVRVRGVDAPRKVTAPTSGGYAVVLNNTSKKTGLDFSIKPA